MRMYRHQPDRWAMAYDKPEPEVKPNGTLADAYQRLLLRRQAKADEQPELSE